MKLRKRTVLLAALALLLLGVCVFYLSSYYPASEQALACLQTPSAGVTVTQQSGKIVFAPDQPTAGLLFYPGGKVEFTAYAPLMDALAQRGILCVLLRMPCNLAVLAPNAAAGIPEQFPEITDWYLAGHSLGGVMAANYAAAHTQQFKGLVLLASYSTEDLTRSGLRVLSVRGSNDGVLNLEKYAAAQENLPAEHTELVLAGGCHAQFGSYGVQQGDGVPTISAEEQISRTAEAVAALIAAAASTPQHGN